MMKPKTKKDWLVIVITGIASLLLLAKLAHVGWKAFAPNKVMAIKAERLDYREGISWAVNAFGAEPPTLASSAKPAVAADVKVFGLLSGTKGSATYALLLIDGQRRELFGVGDEVVSGLTVAEITPFSVTLKSSAGEMILPILQNNQKTKELISSPQKAGDNAGDNGGAEKTPSNSGLITSGDTTRSGRERAAQKATEQKVSETSLPPESGLPAQSKPKATAESQSATKAPSAEKPSSGHDF